ncbi:MAG: cyclase family protein [Pirellulaceae bacterium]
MKITFELGSRTASVDSTAGHSLAIPMNFGGDQPNHFGVDRAVDKTVEVGDFVGDTRRGGSCNVDQLKLIPHCNGTHTESVAHIVNEDVPVSDLAIDVWVLTRLVSVTPVSARDTRESYRPELDHHDHVITADQLQSVTNGADLSEARALIIRTLPNSVDKKIVAWGQPEHPAFLTVEAMTWVVDQEIEHLLLDLPSIDKMYDEGLLTNHHIFWNVPEGTHSLTADVRTTNSITEMAFIEDELADGEYMLNLQYPAFASDAAPSRPVIFPLLD